MEFVTVTINRYRLFPSSISSASVSKLVQVRTFHLKMSSASSFIFMQIKVSFALRLALKQRHKGSRKWSIYFVLIVLHFFFKSLCGGAFSVAKLSADSFIYT